MCGYHLFQISRKSVTLACSLFLQHIASVHSEVNVFLLFKETCNVLHKKRLTIWICSASYWESMITFRPKRKHSTEIKQMFGVGTGCNRVEINVFILWLWRCTKLCFCACSPSNLSYQLNFSRSWNELM